jgi:hypothetical protein
MLPVTSSQLLQVLPSRDLSQNLHKLSLLITKNIEKICPKAQNSGYHKSIERNLPETWISVRRKVSPPFCKPDADDAPVKSLILNASDPFYASTSSLMDCDSTFQAQRLFLHQIC